MQVPKYVTRIARICRRIVTLDYYFNFITVAGDWAEKKWNPRDRKESMRSYYHETDPEKVG